MTARATKIGRRFLLLLAMGGVFAGFPLAAHADLLMGRLTERARVQSTESLIESSSANVEYAPLGEQPARQITAESIREQAFAAVAAILVVPAGTTPVFTVVAPPPPAPAPVPVVTPSTPTVPTTPPSDGGGGHTSGGSTPPPTTPEPGSLVLALMGTGTALAAWLRRRSRTKE